MSISNPPPKRRWPRSQQFELSERGANAERSYREDIIAARVQGGRAAFDAAREAWGGQLDVSSSDGIYLCELQSGPRTLIQIFKAVDGAGATRQETQLAVERLTDAGLVDLVPPPAPPGPPSPPAWDPPPWGSR